MTAINSYNKQIDQRLGVLNLIQEIGGFIFFINLEKRHLVNAQLQLVKKIYRKNI